MSCHLATVEGKKESAVLVGGPVGRAAFLQSAAAGLRTEPDCVPPLFSSEKQNHISECIKINTV